MQFTETPISGVFRIDLDWFRDERGGFARTYCKDEFEAAGVDRRWVQMNYSITANKGSIRGMHFQIPPGCETKLIRVTRGSIFDVAVDLRKDSPTFLQWTSLELSEENGCMILIPEGCAHGFQTLTDDVAMIYHHSAMYDKRYDSGWRHDDPAFAIEWPLPLNTISDKDKSYPLISEDYKGIEL